jgi:non-ribosomal peptide synthetase component F
MRLERLIGPIPSGNLINFLGAMAERPGMSGSDVLLALTPLSFDIAGLELYLPLVVGAQVVMVSRERTRSGRALWDYMREVGASVLQATPSMWRVLTETGWPDFGRVKALCGGEELPWDLAQELVREVREGWNLYGPTETTIWSTCLRLS